MATLSSGEKKQKTELCDKTNHSHTLGHFKSVHSRAWKPRFCVITQQKGAAS